MIDQISKDKIKALKLARKLIKSGEEAFICNALNDSYYYYAVLELRSYINNSLDNCFTLNEYIDDSTRAFWDYKKERLQYIDWMIYCLENPKMSLKEINRTFVPK